MLIPDVYKRQGQELCTGLAAVRQKVHQLVVHLAAGGDVQAHGTDGKAGRKYNVGRLGVAAHVQLPVMHIVGSGHHYDLPDVFLYLGVQI